MEIVILRNGDKEMPYKKSSYEKQKDALLAQGWKIGKSKHEPVAPQPFVKVEKKKEVKE